MRRVGFAVLIASAFVLMAGAQIWAQDTVVFKPEQVPAKGSKIQDFIPSGWKAGSQVNGDLNGDGVADVVLDIVPEDYDTEGIVSGPEDQALLILLTERGGKLRRGGLAPKLLETDVPQYGLDLTTKNGVLIIHQNYGMTDVTDVTHRFRYEASTDRFVLIGRDVYSYHRPQGPDWPAVLVSENYVTGKKLTTTDHWLRNGTNRPTSKPGTVARSHVFFDDVVERVE